MAPKIDTSTASGSEQKLRKARGSTQPGRYAQLRVAREIILADQEAKKAHSTRQATPIPTSSSDSSDSDTTWSPIVSVIGEKHASDTDTTSSTRKARKARSTRQARQIPTPSRKARSTNVIWQHMSQQEVDGRKKNNL